MNKNLQTAKNNLNSEDKNNSNEDSREIQTIDRTGGQNT